MWLGPCKLEGSTLYDPSHGKQSGFYSVCQGETIGGFRQECDLISLIKGSLWLLSLSSPQRDRKWELYEELLQWLRIQAMTACTLMDLTKRKNGGNGFRICFGGRDKT